VRKRKQVKEGKQVSGRKVHENGRICKPPHNMTYIRHKLRVSNLGDWGNSSGMNEATNDQVSSSLV
jgi:hypothetical protein